MATALYSFMVKHLSIKHIIVPDKIIRNAQNNKKKIKFNSTSTKLNGRNVLNASNKLVRL